MPKVSPNHPSILEGRTIFPSSIKEPSGNVLKEASYNSKLSHSGKFILKGKWKGMPLYSLTLEERITCPKDCFRWRECYGNGMYLAQRYKHGAILQSKISSELSQLSIDYPKGFCIRLHILGDFYSTKYVKFWGKMLKKYSQLHIFGYTARLPGSLIGNHIIQYLFPYEKEDRVYIRFSTNKIDDHNNFIYAVREDYKDKATLCPQQTGQLKSCLDCMICVSQIPNIKFLTH